MGPTVHCTVITKMHDSQHQRPEKMLWPRKAVGGGVCSHGSRMVVFHMDQAASIMTQLLPPNKPTQMKTGPCPGSTRLKTQTAKGRLPNSVLIQKNKQGITRQTSSPQSGEYAHEANSFLDHLPCLLPPDTVH